MKNTVNSEKQDIDNTMPDFDDNTDESYDELGFLILSPSDGAELDKLCGLSDLLLHQAI